MKLQALLFGMSAGMKAAAMFNSCFKERLKEQDIIIQIKLVDESIVRYIQIKDGKITSKATVHPKPDIAMVFKDKETAETIMTPPMDYGEQIHAAKNHRMWVEGPDRLVCWYMDTISMMLKLNQKYGTDMGDGVTRFVNNSNGGPCFVYVKDGKVLRTTPIELEDSDAEGWTIEARGQKFTAPRNTTLNPYTIAQKSITYSKDRILYPMKRVDFDPDGERNFQNRGISGYERISWDEALDIVANEIKRMKREYGQGAVAVNTPSHHSWGNVNTYLSSLLRFSNLIGHTDIMPGPESWEGWYWGAMHHWGNSLRMGGGEPYGTVEDCLQEADMIVFWSSDPETSSGTYGAFEGTVRRQWAKDLGIKFVHIDPYQNATAAQFGGKWIAPRPGTDTALAQAICHVWITEGLYDKSFVENNTTGFGEWSDYILGKTDGTPKTPEWQEVETGVPARDARALAREWGKKKTYLGAGGLGNTLGGACRSSSGIQWARMMVIMMGMQGMGRPGVNFGNLQMGTPLDFQTWFPGYVEGGISGELTYTACAINTYQRMPHILSMNTVPQTIPYVKLPEAILEGKASAYATNPSSVQAQFQEVHYPTPGCSEVKMLYNYGSSMMGTKMNSNRFRDMFQADKLEMVVGQAPWMEGGTLFADIILPACTPLERWDISGWANGGAMVIHSESQLNNRLITMQHKCIEPLGESKSDFQIFYELAQRMDLGVVFSEGSTELDWCQRMFESSDIADKISWKAFLKKGYYVIPAPKEELRPPVANRWFYENRKKDVPEPAMPADFKDFQVGLQTTSGKFEFIPETLKKIEDPDRPALNVYERTWEGAHDKEGLAKFPLQLLTPHPRYSFHSQDDGKDGTLNDIEEHRVLVNGHYYLSCRISQKDARDRGIKHHGLIRLYNERGSMICAASITARLRPGVIHASESSAVYQPIDHIDPLNGKPTDIGGCVNVLTPSRKLAKKTGGEAPNSCLIQIEKWNAEEAAA